MAQEGGEKGAAAAAMNGVVEIGARTLPTPVLQLAKFMLEPAEVDALCTQHGLTVHQLMELLVPPAALLARPPTSKFPVGYVTPFVPPQKVGFSMMPGDGKQGDLHRSSGWSQFSAPWLKRCSPCLICHRTRGR